jgi:hypothetical protein
MSLQYIVRTRTLCTFIAGKINLIRSLNHSDDDDDDDARHSELLGFWTLSIIWYSNTKEHYIFLNWICFRPHVRVCETPAVLYPLERAKLNHTSSEI